MMAPVPMQVDPRQQAAQAAQQKALDEFAQAIELLRSDKLRGFRIDIETDSTIQVDAQADKEAAVELVTATFQGLGNAAPLIQQAPELIEPVGQLLMFTFRRFRVGRSIESSLEDALDQIRERMKGPQPPSPEQIKAEAEVKKQQMETERAGMEAQMDQQSKAMDMQMKQAEHRMKLEQMQAEMAMKQQELQLKVRELAMKEREMALSAAIKQQGAAVDMQMNQTKAEAVERQAELGAEADVRKHELGLEAMEAKARAAKQPQAKSKEKK